MKGVGGMPDRKPVVAITVPRGKLVRLKRKKRVRLSFEVDVELVPKNGDLRASDGSA
jgi:hypothetical protein